MRKAAPVGAAFLLLTLPAKTSMRTFLFTAFLAATTLGACAQKTDTLALEAHAKDARYHLIGQGTTVMPGDVDYFEVAKKDYDQLIAWGRTKNLLYRAAICKIKTSSSGFDATQNAALLLTAKQGMQDVLLYEKRYGATAESQRYRQGLEANINRLSSAN